MIRGTLGLLLALWFAGAGATAPTAVRFEAESPAFDDATEGYRRIWAEDGARIFATLERLTGVSLPDRAIRVVVFEGVSRSGRRNGPLHLRASYPDDTRRATLMHEFLHRHLDERPAIAACYDEIHDFMAVVLYEGWSSLWGEAFAREQARVESRRSARYRASWARALARSAAERRAEIDGAGHCAPRTVARFLARPGALVVQGHVVAQARSRGVNGITSGGRVEVSNACGFDTALVRVERVLAGAYDAPDIAVQFPLGEFCQGAWQPAVRDYVFFLAWRGGRWLVDGGLSSMLVRARGAGVDIEALASWLRTGRTAD